MWISAQVTHLGSPSRVKFIGQFIVDQCEQAFQASNTHLAETEACKNIGILNFIFAGCVRLTCFASGQTLSFRRLFLADLTRAGFKFLYLQVCAAYLLRKRADAQLQALVPR